MFFPQFPLEFIICVAAELRQFHAHVVIQSTLKICYVFLFA